MEHCNGIMHTVKTGDTLYSISMEHKVPLALVLRANPYVDVYNLQVGETICVPVKGNMQGGMPPYGSSCDRWEVRDAVPMTKDRKEEEPAENAEELTQQQDDTAIEGAVVPDEEMGENIYVTKEGDSLEEILGVDKILLQPGMTIYRQK